MRLATSKSACAMVLGCVMCSCAHTYEPEAPHLAPSTIEPTQAQWDDALARLDRLRASFPRRPYTQNVRVDLFEPRSRQRFSGRGAVGIDPGRAMRMILIGPGGAPALDVWVTQAAWRMEVPAIRMLRRGGTESPPSTPIGFFRSWFVDPLGGHLLALGGSGELIVRDVAGGTLHVVRSAGETHVRRRHGTQTETFSYRLDKNAHAAYRDEGSRLEVDVELEPIQGTPPDPSAFVDPDANGRGQ